METIIDEEVEEEDQVKMTVQDYILSADWCHSLQPSRGDGRDATNSLQPSNKSLKPTIGFMITLGKCWWPSNIYCTLPHLKATSTWNMQKYPHFSNQLCTYTDQLWIKYPTKNPTDLLHNSQNGIGHPSIKNTTKDQEIPFVSLMNTQNYQQMQPSELTNTGTAGGLV